VATLVVAAAWLGVGQVKAAPEYIAYTDHAAGSEGTAGTSGDARHAATLGSFNAVSVAPRSSSAWAVGYRGHGATQSSYAVHRVGGQWRPVAVAAASTGYLQSVAAGSSRSIWAVGDRVSHGRELPQIEHSTGGRFSSVSVALGAGSLQAVAASSASSAWAVGDHPGSSAHPFGRPLVARWDGTSWSQVTVGGAPAGWQVTGVSVSGPNNVWLLGNVSGVAEVARWNGKGFTLGQPRLPAGAIPTSIATTSASSTWVSAYVPGPVGSGAARMVVSHWNGHSWRSTPLTSLAIRNVPASIAAVGNTVFLTGYDGPKNPAKATPFVLELRRGHWRSAEVVAVGKNAQLLSISVSSKLAVAVGSWYAGPAAGSHQLPPHPLLTMRHGRAWHPTQAM
jgi:hypothetical protein